MFSSIGWGEIVVLLAAGLIILGPERLPGAVSWTLQSIRKVRDYATGASGQLRDEMGTDFEQFREPIQQINELRQMTPKGIVTKHLLGGDSTAVDDLGRSVRDTLDIQGVGAAPDQSIAAPSDSPGPDLTKLGSPATPSGTSGPSTVKRTHDYTDWDAT
ncbi:sec-independent protein translocase protein TatB [Gordonia malaquae]|uniref:Sec-independent protein translocase protein TatB homolog n=1 Tax=Gordonia malaquae NBRC 108250 TaxID=1223542 RepID=M3VC65_GORML|nr:Sec-independent protein translocase protein TatB [Gordonia malaquae]GAC81473.1 Sec-independent protein translocase protein TatB homolog [Gordonia malaquae NBRC 108250]SEC26773.1 sec-independent protein translocase protein TatB [Gordonia malaquae]